MAIGAEAQAELNILRSKAEAGTATLEDYKRSVILMRGERQGAHIASEKSRGSKGPTKRAAIPSADDLLDELGA